VRNQGNALLTGLGLKVLLVDPDSGQQVGQILDTATLAPGAVHSASGPFATTGLAAKVYIAVLIAVLPGSGLEQTLASANLTVVNVNAPPDCALAKPQHEDLWPPNHRYVDVSVAGVTDADGDPVTTRIVSVLQDEPTDGRGDGSTCPDARGIGTPTAQVRAERSGDGDGRVYHIRFQSDDGRGGTCTGTVKVCVPHDQGHGDDDDDDDHDRHVADPFNGGDHDDDDGDHDGGNDDENICLPRPDHDDDDDDGHGGDARHSRQDCDVRDDVDGRQRRDGRGGSQGPAHGDRDRDCDGRRRCACVDQGPRFDSTVCPRRR
jgi:hypothetical protein